MNFSTVPPYRSSSCRRVVWYGRIRARTSSGSARSEAAVKPTRSQKSADTIFRSSLGAAAATSGVPQPLQNLAASGFSVSQLGQITDRA